MQRSQKPTRKIIPRLVKVQVVPVFVLDDGEDLTEHPQEPIVVAAADWPTYSSERFPVEVERWTRQLNGEEGSDGR